MPLIPGIPDIPGSTPVVPIRPPPAVDPTAISGELYFVMLIILGGIVVTLIIAWVCIRIWGNPILIAKSARLSGEAIIQHLENSKIGVLKLARIGGGALRHKEVTDGTLITIPKGISNLEGLSFVNSWHLGGISMPIFLIGAITKLKHVGAFADFKTGLNTRADLVRLCSGDNKIGDEELIKEAYNFVDFNDLIKKSKEPSLIPLEIEYATDFIKPVNQHYTESIITKKVYLSVMSLANDFYKVIITTAIAVFIVALAIYFLVGQK